MTNTEKKMRGERGAGAHWRMLHLQADTMAAARDMARSTGRWQVARRGQGDGKRTLVLECNEHINCEVKRRVALAKDNMFHIFELGEHAQTENTKKRKNSALDVEQQKELLCTRNKYKYYVFEQYSVCITDVFALYSVCIEVYSVRCLSARAIRRS